MIFSDTVNRCDFFVGFLKVGVAENPSTPHFVAMVKATTVRPHAAAGTTYSSSATARRRYRCRTDVARVATSHTTTVHRDVSACTYIGRQKIKKIDTIIFSYNSENRHSKFKNSICLNSQKKKHGKTDGRCHMTGMYLLQPPVSRGSSSELDVSHRPAD